MFLPVLAVTALISLRAGDDAVLTHSPADDASIRFVETEGSQTVVRLVLDTASRIVVMMPFEERTVRLRDVFHEDALRSSELQVEVLQGGGVTVNAAELRPQAEPTRRHRAVAPPKALPTSFALIDQAEASGAINSETALLYRVYAIFSDARLPAQFRGDDKGITDSVYLAEVMHQYGTLSPPVRAAVQPFLIPPAYQGSWMNRKAGSPLPALLPSPLTPCETSLFADHWRFVDATVPVRIHYREDVANDQTYANGVAAEIDRIIWSKLVNLMYPGGAGTSFPLSDESHPCNGGNSRLDVYLVDTARSYTTSLEVCQPASSFIGLLRGADSAVAAHELFHTLQFSFPVRTCNLNLNNDRWWAEASAHWAIDYVYGRDQQYEQASAYEVLNDPKVSIDFTNDKHEYGAYLFPFFQSHKSGSADFVRQAWLNCATDEATAALDKALSGGFEKVWPQFAKYNWNEPTFDYYKQWDGLVFGARPEEGGPLTIGVGTPQFSISLPYNLPPLSAIYHHFKFDENLSSVVFWNGVMFKLSKQESACCGPVYGIEEAPPEQVKGGHVDALINIDGTWREEDWTDRKWVKLCRDTAAEKIDELVLIISYSDIRNRDYRLYPRGLDPVLFASTMGCSGWEGTGTFTNNRVDLSSTLKINATASWRPVNVEPDKPPALILYEATGNQSWTVTGDCNGSGTLGIDAGFSALLTANFVPPESSFTGTYSGYGVNAGKDVTIHCKDFGDVKITLDPWFQPPIAPVVPGIPNARFVKVKPNGKLIDDSNHPNEDPNQTSAWHFEAKRD